MQKTKPQQGFTLIELMIVIAIMGVLAAAALPIYQDFTARAQVAEGLVTAGAIKTSISEFNAAQGAFPGANTYDDNVGGRYTLSATHSNTGVITVTLRGAVPVSTRIQGFTFTLSPFSGGVAAADGDVIDDWQCATSDDKKFLPQGCQA